MEGLLCFALEQIEHLGILCIDRNIIKYVNTSFCGWLEINKESIIETNLSLLNIKIQSSGENLVSFLERQPPNTKVSVNVTFNHSYRVEVSVNSESSTVCLFHKIYRKGKKENKVVLTCTESISIDIKKKSSYSDSLMIENPEDPTFVLSALQEVCPMTFNVLEYYPSLHDFKILYDSHIHKSRWSTLLPPDPINTGKFIERDLHLGYHSPIWELAKQLADNPKSQPHIIRTEYTQPDSNSSPIVISIFAKFLGISKISFFL